MVERLSMAILALLAVVLGVNYVSASSRFLDANRAYDELELELQSFQYRNPQSPVYYSIVIRNPADTSIDVMEMRTTLRAGVHLVGGGDVRIADTLSPGSEVTFDVAARINDVAVLERVETDGAIEWLIRGEVQVRFDESIEPVWVRFAVRTQTP